MPRLIDGIRTGSGPHVTQNPQRSTLLGKRRTSQQGSPCSPKATPSASPQPPTTAIFFQEEVTARPPSVFRHRVDLQAAFAAGLPAIVLSLSNRVQCNQNSKKPT